MSLFTIYYDVATRIRCENNNNNKCSRPITFPASLDHHSSIQWIRLIAVRRRSLYRDRQTLRTCYTRAALCADRGSVNYLFLDTIICTWQIWKWVVRVPWSASYRFSSSFRISRGIDDGLNDINAHSLRQMNDFIYICGRIIGHCHDRHRRPI